jgi:hypothetical protein
MQTYAQHGVWVAGRRDTNEKEGMVLQQEDVNR